MNVIPGVNYVFNPGIQSHYQRLLPRRPVIIGYHKMITATRQDTSVSRRLKLANGGNSRKKDYEIRRYSTKVMFNIHLHSLGAVRGGSQIVLMKRTRQQWQHTNQSTSNPAMGFTRSKDSALTSYILSAMQQQISHIFEKVKRQQLG